MFVYNQTADQGDHICLDTKIVYRRYASLFFICSISNTDNELLTLEIVHRYVEVLDRYFGNVCELDLIFNFQKAYAVSC
jgi:AP-1 complex subunit sigma 1/2